MAQLLKKLEDQLKCSICLDTYTNPKQLQCNHVYCQQCLVKLVFRDQQGQLFLTCPSCRQVTPVPASEVAGLHTSFLVNQLLDIVEEHKKAASSSVSASFDRVDSDSGSPSQSGNIRIVCSEHGGKEVELYCETCGKTICWKCIKKGEKHHGHNYEELDEAFEQYTEEISLLLEPIEKQVAVIKASLSQLDTCHDEISDQCTTIEADIHKTIDQLHQILDARKTELIGQLHQLTQAKLKSLAVQRDQLETTQAQLSSCLLFMRENLKTGNQAEALLMKHTTVRQVKELTTTFQPDMLKSSTEADIVFSTLEDLSAECQNYGKVYAAGSPDPSECFVTGKAVEAIEVGEQYTVVFQTSNFISQPCEVPITSISCELVSEIVGTTINNNIKRIGQSLFQISCQPTIKGRHQLHITVEGQHIKGSPFSINVRSSVEKLGTPILTIEEVKKPVGVAVNPKGEVIVTESSECCVTVFSPSGERRRSFGSKGSGQGQFGCPVGVAVDSEENIYVADNHNHQIQKFTPEGKFLAVVGAKGIGPLQFRLLRGLAFNTSNNQVYVVDAGNSRIQILNSDLSYYNTFGELGKGKVQFYCPRQIACDRTGNVYVVDSGNYRIQILSSEGKFLRMFGTNLRSPYGIAVDSSDRVYVSEDDHRVSVFTSMGVFLSSFGGEGKDPGELKVPRGLAVDNCGTVYVCDKGDDLVQLF